MTFRVLLSFHYYRQDIQALYEGLFPPPYPPTFADSGGFSAATQGAVIAIEEYAAWLQANSHLFDTYANFDVIGDAEATWENQKWLESQGLRPLPVFHIGSEWKWLDHYINEGHDYIAIGGMVGRPRAAVMSWCIKAHQVARKAGVVLHGFGLTTWVAIMALPWYSVDSSSGSAAPRFGRVVVFDPRRLTWGQFHLGDRVAYQYGNLLRYYGFEPSQFVDRTIDRKGMMTLAALCWAEAERVLRTRHGIIRRPSTGVEGLRIYHAVGPKRDIKFSLVGMRDHLAAGKVSV